MADVNVCNYSHTGIMLIIAIDNYLHLRLVGLVDKVNYGTFVQDCSFPRLFVPMVELSFSGMNGPFRMVHGPFVPNGPWTIRSLDHSWLQVICPKGHLSVISGDSKI